MGLVIIINIITQQSWEIRLILKYAIIIIILMCIMCLFFRMIESNIELLMRHLYS